MNKKLMAVAVAGAIGAPGLAFAQAANVSVYGHFDGNLRSTKFSSSSVVNPTSGTVGQAAGTQQTPVASSQTKQHLHFNAPRWGLRGSEALGGGMTAYFQLESGMSPDGRPITTDGNIATLGGRDSYIGVRSTSWGSFQVGGFSTAYTNVAGIWNAVSSMGHAQIIMGNTDTTGSANNPNCGAAVAGPTGTVTGGNTLTGSPAIAGQSITGGIIGGSSAPASAASSAVAAGTAAGNLGVSCTSQVEGNALSFSRRASNYIEYASPNMSGFVGRIGMAVPENAEPNSQTNAVAAANLATSTAATGVTRFNPKHFSYALTWSGGPFSAGIGHETHEGFRGANTNGAASTGLGLIRNAKDKGTTVGGKWNFGAGEIGVGWERLKYGNSNSAAGAGNDFQITNMVINGNYKISAVGTISSGYSKTPGRKNCGAGLTAVASVPVAASDPGLCGSATGANMFSLSYDHSLSKRTGLYAAYGKINNGGNATGGATYNYIAGPLSNGAAGTAGGLVGGTDLKTYMVGMKHSF